MSQQPQQYQVDPNEFLMGGGVKSASFLKIGDSVTGVICEPPKMQQQRDMQTSEPKVWQDGSPMMQLVVTLQTDERDNNTEEEDDGRRRVYIKFNMKNAVADAVRKAGAKALEVGGKLTVTHTSVGKPPAKGFSPPKFYTAVYVPPAAGFLNEPDKGDESGRVAPPQQQADQPAWTPAMAEEAYVKAGGVKGALFPALKAAGHAKWTPEAREMARDLIAKLATPEEELPF